MRQPSVPRETAPEPERVRGHCPHCRAAVVSALVYTAGRGYLIIWRCSSCEWRRVL